MRVFVTGATGFIGSAIVRELLAAGKTRQAWIWIALCRKTRQVVAYAVGDRSEATCCCLWEAIPCRIVQVTASPISGLPIKP